MYYYIVIIFLRVEIESCVFVYFNLVYVLVFEGKIESSVEKYSGIYSV